MESTEYNPQKEMGTIMPIKYHPIPDQCEAEIFIKGQGFLEKPWRAEIATSGEIIQLVDPDGNCYKTEEDLQNANVERFTLNNQHIVWLPNEEPKQV